MTQCTFRRFKQFALVFLVSWAVAVFFANQNELVQRFENILADQIKLSTIRAEQAKEFFHKNQKLQTVQNENTDDKQLIVESQIQSQGPVKTSQQKSQLQNQNPQEDKKDQAKNQQKIAVASQLEPAQKDSQLKAVVEQSLQVAKKQADVKQAADARNQSQNIDLIHQKIAEPAKKQKQVQKQTGKRAQASPKASKQDKRQEKQSRQALNKESKRQKSQQKQQRPNRYQRQSQKPQRSGKRTQKVKKNE